MGTPSVVWLEPDFETMPCLWFNRKGNAVLWLDAPISEALAQRIGTWLSAWERTAYLGIPWPSAGARESWLQDGDELVAAVQAELSHLGCEVIERFHDLVDSDLPNPPRRRE